MAAALVALAAAGCTGRIGDAASRSADGIAAGGATGADADGAPDAGTAPDSVAPPDAGPPTVVIAAAGDIACAGCFQGMTADLLQTLAAAHPLAAILPLGDNAYDQGLLTEYQASYAPAWGRPALLALTHPVPGNHEYAQGATGADGYFDYFNGVGVASGPAGMRGRGFYSYDVGAWHVVALNSSGKCQPVSCAPGSLQVQWLAADLAAHPARCTLAYWHHPRFQAGATHADTPETAALWDALYDGAADLVLAGHEHNYQQFGPMNKAGEPDPARGIRSFVVGTGGVSRFYTTFTDAHAASFEARYTGGVGVLELTLRPDGYDWRFVTPGGQVPPGASGTGSCH